MSEPDLEQIARVLKANGTGGDLIISLRGIDPSDILTEEPVFISFDGLPVPFFIENITPKGSGKAIVHLNDIDNLKDAEEVVGREIFCRAGVYSEPEGEVDLTGWEAFDGERPIGRIRGYEDIPGNPCIYLEDGKMIPLHDDFISSLDSQKKNIIFSLPEGLV